MVNAGNTRRENSQAYLIPLLAQAGFNVVPSNGTAEEVFQQRLPAPRLRPGDVHLDGAAGPVLPDADPSPATRSRRRRTTSRVRTSRGGATRRPPRTSTQRTSSLTRPHREELVKSALTATETDFVLLPLVNYPKSGAWRTDKVGGPLDGDTANYRAFDNFHQWEDVDGDGQIVIGAEQWPALSEPGHRVRELLVVDLDRRRSRSSRRSGCRRTSRPSRSPTW